MHAICDTQSVVLPPGLANGSIHAEGIRAIKSMGIASAGDPYLLVHSVSSRPKHGDPKTLVFATLPMNE